MVEYLMQTIASLLSVVLLGLGGLSASGGTSTTVIDVPAPTAAPVVSSEARYPTHALWDMPFGLTVDEVAAILQEKTGQTPSQDDSSLRLSGASNISILGYPVDFYAYFSEPYGKQGMGKELSSVSFDLSIAGSGNFGLRQPVTSQDSTKQVAAGIIPRIEEVAASAVEEFGPLTSSEVAVWKESDSELEYVASPIAPDGTLDTEQLLDIVTTYRTMLFYLRFDNVEVAFYTAFEDGYETYYIVSPSVRYSYYDFTY